MKKKVSPECDLDDNLRPEYPVEFFRDMKPNRFAGTDLKFKDRPSIILDADVAKVFDSPEAVNTVLRSVIKAMRTATITSVAKPVRKAVIPASAGAKRRAS